MVTATNSLVGGTANDGANVITALTNGNYVVSCSSWDNPSPVRLNVGAATWGNGAGGTVGLVTATNSLGGGDGKADAAVFRNGTWHILNSENGEHRSERFGQASDKPIPKAF